MIECVMQKSGLNVALIAGFCALLTLLSACERGGTAILKSTGEKEPIVSKDEELEQAYSEALQIPGKR